ncbi:Blp family class II bacteriocin [Leminorella grimontii]|nr:Blp family class II bacteriocin [Leminorella grimontii]KFC96299.1 hypothetical protein GLGR_1475 [Leminorella grimontii ATCC 33999 = DSM 5078]VFS59055.1 Uncharacterised protein [Leminorella grimontii]
MRELNKNEMEAVNGGCIEGALDGAACASAIGQSKGWDGFSSFVFSAFGAAVGAVVGSDAATKFLKLFA